MSADVMSSVGVRPPALTELLGVGEDLQGDLDQRVVGATELGITDAEDHVGPLEDLLRVALRDAHHRADDLEREGTREGLDEVGRAIGVLGDHPVDEVGGDVLDLLLDRRDVLGREPLRHDRAEPEVLGVVHRDHRSEELAEFLVEIADVDPAAARTEQLRIAAGVPDVVVAGDGVVPRAGGQRRVLEGSFGIERKSGCVSDQPEPVGPLVAVTGPEVPTRDVGQSFGRVNVGSRGHRSVGHASSVRAPVT